MELSDLNAMLQRFRKTYPKPPKARIVVHTIDDFRSILLRGGVSPSSLEHGGLWEFEGLPVQAAKLVAQPGEVILLVETPYERPPLWSVFR